MIKIENNFLNNDYFFEMQKIVFSDEFPWYLQNFKVEEGDGNTQFTHNLVKSVGEKQERKPSSFFTLLMSDFVSQIGATNIIRAKLNLTLKSNEIVEFKPHVDSLNQENSLTSIFYMNTNNGYTQIVNGNKIDSVENRLVTFLTDTLHFGTTHTDVDYRAVLNIVYIK